MDYGRHYDLLIERARGRTLNAYSERHHIIPRCLGGSDDPANMVRLTAEEHFVAHQLLVKMHPGHIGLIWALSAMCNGSRAQRRNNKRYGWLRRKFARALSERYRGQRPSPQCIEAGRQSARRRRGSTYGPEHRAAISAGKKGLAFSAQHRANLATAKRGRTGAKRSPEARARMAAAQQRSAATRDFSYVQSDEYRANHRARMKQWWADRKAAGGVTSQAS